MRGLLCCLACMVNCLQASQPFAAKLYAGALNASYQANATREAAQTAFEAAQEKLLQSRQHLAAATASKTTALSTAVGVPGQLGAAVFQVNAASQMLLPKCKPPAACVLDHLTICKGRAASS